MVFKDGQDRADVEMRKVDRVRDAVVEGCGSIFEQRHHLRMDRSEDDQPASHCAALAANRSTLACKIRAELLITLAIEVLELVENQYEASFGHRLQQLGELQKIIGPRILVGGNVKCLQGVIDR